MEAKYDSSKLKTVLKTSELEPCRPAVGATLAEFLFQHARFSPRAGQLHWREHQQDQQPPWPADGQNQTRDPEPAEDLDWIANSGINSTSNQRLRFRGYWKRSADL